MLCFRNIGVAKKFMHENRREYQDFPPKKFCLRVPKIVVESFWCFINSDVEKS